MAPAGKACGNKAVHSAVRYKAGLVCDFVKPWPCSLTCRHAVNNPVLSRRQEYRLVCHRITTVQPSGALSMQYSDFSTAAFYANPYPFYDEMRAAGAIVKLAPGLFVTGRYSIVDKLLVDRRLGKGIEASARARYGDDVIDQPLFRLARQMLLRMNPPQHTRLASLLMRAFNAPQIEKFRQISHDISNRLVDALAPTGHCDLFS